MDEVETKKSNEISTQNELRRLQRQLREASDAANDTETKDGRDLLLFRANRWVPSHNNIVRCRKTHLPSRGVLCFDPRLSVIRRAGRAANPIYSGAVISSVLFTLYFIWNHSHVHFNFISSDINKVTICNFHPRSRVEQKEERVWRANRRTNLRERQVSESGDLPCF